MFLGVSAAIDAWNADFTACTLRLPDNPLSDFVELPPSMSDLRYSNIITGVLRGAMEMVRCAVRDSCLSRITRTHDTRCCLTSCEPRADCT